ncbi:MAG TPA: hypothetical protein VJQ57_09505 [Acidimicrobiia bacterium]|nr:hypothetical protein [Acidimicrobiia bacterium]
MGDEIHVVSSGLYSDYQVLCACPSKEDAETVAAKLRGDRDGWRSDAVVETLPLVSGDVRKVEILLMQETVWDDGRTDRILDDIRAEWPFDSLRGIVRVAWRWVRAPMHNNQGGRLEVWGTDHNRVRKVFSDRRAMALADDGFRMQREAKGRG